LSLNDVYTPTKLVETEGFRSIKITFVPLPINKLARTEREMDNRARDAAKKACKAAKIEPGKPGYDERFAEEYAEAEYLELAAFLNDRIRGWDWTENGKPVAVSPDAILSLPLRILTNVVAVVKQYANGKDCEDDEKKSESPQG
jgi:hypothetical protein